MSTTLDPAARPDPAALPRAGNPNLLTPPKSKKKLIPLEFYVYCVTLSISLLPQFAAWLLLPSQDAARWISNDLSFNLFVPICFPLAVTLVWSSLRRGVLLSINQPARAVLVSILIALLVASVTGVGTDALSGRPIPPHFLKGSFVQDEIKLRGTLSKPHDVFATDQKEKSRDVQKKYLDLVKPPISIADFLLRTSFAAYVALLINLLTVSFSAVLLWYIFVLFLVPSDTRASVRIDRLIAAFALLLLFFPARLYTEWYLSFYSPELESYTAIWLLAVAAVVFGVFIILDKFRSHLAAASGVIASAISGGAWLWAKLDPTGLAKIAEIVEDAPMPFFYVLFLVLLAAFAVFSLAVAAGKLPLSDFIARTRKHDDD